MRHSTATCAGLVALVLCGLINSTQADLVITEVMPQTTAGSAGAINGDWWELTNTGPAAVDLNGYQWSDTEDQVGGPTPQPNLFPSFIINPGQSIIISEEDATSDANWRTNWALSPSVAILFADQMMPSPGATDTFSGLGSNDDGVFFYSPIGTQLSSYSYAANTRGVSFEQSVGGVNLGVSIVGENGAIMAANGDIGSPGIAVPEPATWCLLGTALFGFALLRRGKRGIDGRTDIPGS